MMVVLDFARHVDAINFNSYIDSVMNIRARVDFVETLEYILSCNPSLWFTYYGVLYRDHQEREHDCKLTSPARVTHQTYTVVIYNRYHDGVV
jgi:hypothetical protein